MTSAPKRRPLRILFFLWALNFDRVFECFLRELLERGHSVEVLVERSKVLPVGAGEVFDELARDFDGRLSWMHVPERRGARQLAAGQLRRTMDYLRYLEPEFATAEALRSRARGRLSRPAAWLLDQTERRPRLRSRVRKVLGTLERALPPDPQVIAEIAARDPDVVMVSPLITLGSPQSDVIPAANALGKPTVLPVASWDNLTNKGLVRSAPTRTIVWNELQANEAVQFHGLPPESVFVVGAHAYDHWFSWSPRHDARTFAESVGLDPDRPFFVYACSSSFIAGDETVFVREWLRRLRDSGGALATVGVLVRPHPQNVAAWRKMGLDDPRAVVWPREGEVPTAAGRKAGYFDSLYHSKGVIGINTSALIEAAIVGRPVFTMLTDRYHATQEGTLHFEHLTGSDGAVLNTAATWADHTQQLRAALSDPDAFTPRIHDFVLRFVRPHGLAEPGAPAAADVVEGAVLEPPAQPSRPRLARAVVRFLILAASARPAGRQPARAT